ncbi:MAG: hypothetical protein ABFD69_16485 [Candidatus Sumerlaeia bacterium]
MAGTRAKQVLIKWGEGIVFLAAMAGVLLYRHFNIPPSGGETYAAWWAGLLIGGVVFYCASHGFPLRWIALLLVPIAIAYEILLMYFDIKIFDMVFALLCGLVVFINEIRKTSRGERIFTFSVISIMLLILIPISIMQAGQISWVRELTHLDPAAVKAITISNDDADGRTIVITDQPTIRAFCRALANTYPYSPEKEDIHRAWTCLIETPARNYRFRLGKGNRRNPNAVWIELPRHSIYQNLDLYPVVQAGLPQPLWK